MADQDYATVGGTRVHKSDFGYAPGDEPSKWKFPLHDASHVRDAMARFNQSKGIPADAKAALKRKIIERAHKYGIDTTNFEKEYSRDSGLGTRDSGMTAREAGQPSLTPNPENRTPIVVLLTGAGAAVDTPSDIALHGPSTQLREIAIAVPGSWVKGDHSFSISSEDMSDMVRNFDKRKNGMIPIDFEHASEMPEIARGGAVPAAGWIHALRSGVRSLEPGGSDAGRGTSDCLTALVEWTPQAEEMLRTGQYRFFSPAIDWGAQDKDTGEPQGATLTSGALTNHPFLEELPPIMLSDGTIIWKGVMTMAEKKKEKLEDPEEELADNADDQGGKDGHDLPMLKIRKGRAGSKHEGHHILSDGGSDVGCMSDEDLRQHAAKHLGVNPDDAEDEKETAREAQRHALLLTEVAKGGKIDSRKAIELADAGKITFADYIRAQEAEKMIDAAVREGKILPRHRAFFFRDALERPAEFAEYAKNAQAVKLGAVGFGDSERPDVDQEVDLGVKKLMSEKKLDYASAYRQFCKDNPVLIEQYRQKHTHRVNADGTAV
jgi:phage I-like protein